MADKPISTKQARIMAESDYSNGQECRVIEHPEHPSQIAYDMRYWELYHQQTPEIDPEQWYEGGKVF